MAMSRRKWDYPEPVEQITKQGTTWLCPEGCGYKHKNQGAVWLHTWQKHYREQSRSKGREMPGHNKKQETPTKESLCKCGGNVLLFLKPRKREHVRALRAGYSQYCAECEELY